MVSQKWERGRPLSPVEALQQIAEGRPVYFNHKWTHSAWARGWQTNTLINNANAGRIYEANKIEEPST